MDDKEFWTFRNLRPKSQDQDLSCDVRSWTCAWELGEGRCQETRIKTGTGVKGEKKSAAVVRWSTYCVYVGTYSFVSRQCLGEVPCGKMRRRARLCLDLQAPRAS